MIYVRSVGNRERIKILLLSIAQRSTTLFHSRPCAVLTIFFGYESVVRGDTTYDALKNIVSGFMEEVEESFLGIFSLVFGDKSVLSDFQARYCSLSSQYAD